MFWLDFAKCKEQNGWKRSGINQHQHRNHKQRSVLRVSSALDVRIFSQHVATRPDPNAVDQLQGLFCECFV